MRFLVMVKATDLSPGQGPTPEMKIFNDALERDGMLLAAEGLQLSGTRISFAGGKPVVTDGPFAEAKEVVAGFWILEARSKEGIVERLLECPFERGEGVEIRQIAGGRKFGENASST